MDTKLLIQTAVVDFLVTGILIGVLIYYIQHEIKKPFDEHMEEFKANLQRLNFEQQTKFVRNHEKMVETLETIYKSFSDFSTSTSKLLIESLDLLNPNNDSLKLSEYIFFNLAIQIQ